MKDESKLKKIYKRITDSEESIKRLPVYFFLICVLLVCLLFKLNKTNSYLEKIAANGTRYVEVETITGKSDLEAVVKPSETESYPPALSVVENTTKKENKEQTTAEATKTSVTEPPTDTDGKTTYVINKNSKKIHRSDCTFVDRMSDENKLVVKLTKEEYNQYINNGYTRCSSCGG